MASVPWSVDDPLATHQACAEGTLLMLDAARRAGASRFVYAASSSAYGDQERPAKTEDLLPRPLSPYAAAKLAGEHYCQAFWRSYGFPAVSLRYFNVFGPRQDPAGPYAAVIPRFIEALVQGESPVVFGDGRQTRDFTYAANVAQANLLASEAPVDRVGGETFNIAGGAAVDLLELLSILGQLLNIDPRPRFEPARAGDVRDSLADISKARRVLGFEPAVDLREGLARTVRWRTGRDG